MLREKIITLNVFIKKLESLSTLSMPETAWPPKVLTTRGSKVSPYTPVPKPSLTETTHPYPPLGPRGGRTSHPSRDTSTFWFTTVPGSRSRAPVFPTLAILRDTTWITSSCRIRRKLGGSADLAEVHWSGRKQHEHLLKFFGAYLSMKSKSTNATVPSKD